MASPPGVDLRERPLRVVSYERLNVHDSGCEQKFFAGRLWETYFRLPNVRETRPIDENWSALWTKWASRLRAQGWEETCTEYISGLGLKRTIDSVEYRLSIGLGDRDEVDVGLVRVGDPPMLLVALPPFDVSETSDWPWLPEFPARR